MRQAGEQASRFQQTIDANRRSLFFFLPPHIISQANECAELQNQQKANISIWFYLRCSKTKTHQVVGILLLMFVHLHRNMHITTLIDATKVIMINELSHWIQRYSPFILWVFKNKMIIIEVIKLRSIFVALRKNGFLPAKNESTSTTTARNNRSKTRKQ